MACQGDQRNIELNSHWRNYAARLLWPQFFYEWSVAYQLLLMCRGRLRLHHYGL